MLAHDDLALTAALGVEHVGFGAPGTARGPQAIVERDVYEVDAARLEYVRERLRRGTSVTAVAENEHGPIAVGTLRPVGAVAEIVGVATLPAVRRQGLGGAVTALLVEHALSHRRRDGVPERRERRRGARVRAPRLPSHRHRMLRPMNAIERYYDAVPRSAARVEEIGPFTLFVSTGAWPYYARPRLGLEHDFTVEEIETVRVRQRELGIPEAFEWVHEVTPSLLGVMPLPVMEAPLMVLPALCPPTSRGRDRPHDRGRRPGAGRRGRRARTAGSAGRQGPKIASCSCASGWPPA